MQHLDLTDVVHKGRDQVLPYAEAALQRARLLQNATLKAHEGLSHGMLTVNADLLNAETLAFIQRG